MSTPAHNKPFEDELADSDSEEWQAPAVGSAPSSVPAGLPVPPVASGQPPMPYPNISSEEALAASRKYVAYTVKLPSEQLAALNSIWLELKRLYGTHSPDKSGMIQLAITDWLRKWEGPERNQLLQDLLDIRQDTRRRQYRK